jgi:hypothetical protein
MMGAIFMKLGRAPTTLITFNIMFLWSFLDKLIHVWH